MRIISGKYGGRRLAINKSFKARPTTDFAKENLFNILNNFVDYQSVKVLDLFSGTGSISFEFVSRGCTDVTAVESEYRHIQFIHQIKEQLGIQCLRPVKMNAFTYIKRTGTKFDLIFADPPYTLLGIEELPDMIFEYNLLEVEGVFILEHSGQLQFESHKRFVERRKYGSVNFSFFR